MTYTHTHQANFVPYFNFLLYSLFVIIILVNEFPLRRFHITNQSHAKTPDEIKLDKNKTSTHSRNKQNIILSDIFFL